MAASLSVEPSCCAFLAMLGITGLTLLTPYLLKVAVDQYIALGDRMGLARIAILTAAAFVGLYLFTAAQQYLLSWVGQRVLANLRSELMHHLQRLSLSFYARASVGDLIYRVTSDTYSIQALAMNGLFPIVAAVLLLGGMFVVMVRLDWQLTVVALGVCPLLLAAVVVMNRRITAIAMDARLALKAENGT